MVRLFAISSVGMLLKYCKPFAQCCTMCLYLMHMSEPRDLMSATCTGAPFVRRVIRIQSTFIRRFGNFIRVHTLTRVQLFNFAKCARIIPIGRSPYLLLLTSLSESWIGQWSKARTPSPWQRLYREITSHARQLPIVPGSFPHHTWCCLECGIRLSISDVKQVASHERDCGREPLRFRPYFKSHNEY